MNVLTIFEQRIGAILEGGAPGEKPPFSFKRLAKRAVREMEDETFVIDGVDTAPALYTILISADDDALMRSMYHQITDELAQLIEAQAKKRGYTFVGRPLVRFMVDPALRHGKYSVFAENIDPRTLARLRDEENAYLGITPPQAAYAHPSFMPQPVPVHDEEPAPIAHEVAFVAEVAPEVVASPAPQEEPLPTDEPLADSFDEPVDEPLSQEESATPGEAFVEAESPAQDVEMGSVAGVDTFDAAVQAMDELPSDEGPIFTPEPPQIEEEPQAPAAHMQATPPFVPVAAPQPDPEPEPEPEPMPSCTLVDLQTGQTFHVDSGYMPIGRERTSGGIVLADPNVSRRHAELVFNGTAWQIRDLNSTNGTLVNDLDVREARLFDGDVLTIGLTNLEFRAG